MNKIKDNADFEQRFRKTTMYNQIAGYARATNHSYKTKDTYLQSVNHICRAIYNFAYIQRVENITAKHVSWYVLEELGNNKSISCLKKELAALRDIVKYCEAWSGGKRKAKFKEQDNKKLGLNDKIFNPRTSINENQFMKMQNILETGNSQNKKEFKAMQNLQYYLGLRAEESTLVRWDQLKNAVKTGKLMISEGTKGGRKRTITLIEKKQIEVINEVLKEFESKRKQQYLFIVKNEYRDNTRLYNSYINWYYNNQDKLQKCGPDKSYNQFDNLSSHTLRHSYAEKTYRFLRGKGYNHKDAWGTTSEYLGHGRQRMELFKTYCFQCYLEDMQHK